MYTPVFWIKTGTPGQLGLMARPRGGEWLADELHALAMRKVGLIVSVLESSEKMQYGLENLASACATHALELYAFPMPPRGVPTAGSTLKSLMERILSALQAGTDVVIQGGRGQGRAPLLAAVVLQALGFELPDSLRRLRKAARGLVVPKHPDQQAWLRQQYPSDASIFQDL